MSVPDQMALDGIKITRRHLPHWTLEESTYFITFRVRDGKFSIEEQKRVLEHIKLGNAKFYNLLAAQVMPDHVHVLLQPRPGFELARIMRGMKGASARKLNQARGETGSVWQDESYDRIVRDYDELIQKLEYMLNNPVKKKLCEDPWTYHGWYYNEEAEK